MMPGKSNRKSGKLLVFAVVLALVFSLVPVFSANAAVSQWQPGVWYNVGDLAAYNGTTYQCIQAHTSQTGWEPPNVPALWKVSSDPTPTPTATQTPTPTPTATLTPTPSPSSGACTAPAWDRNAIYTGGQTVSHNGHQWKAKWWTQGEEPGTTGEWGVWQDLGACSGATPTPTPTVTPTPTPTGPTPTPTSGNWPSRVFAPYVDVMLYPNFQLTQTAQNVGTKYYTLAFIVDGGGCQARWGGIIPLSDNYYLNDINSLRQMGGNVIISFGGAAGMELGQACTSVSSLQAQYQAVIDKYSFTSVDFDIEGASIADMTANDRRNKAIAGLQRANSSLTVSYTLPTMPSGLTQDGVNLLSNAVANGVRVDKVNVMAMDYGSSADPYKMGQNAIDAANSLFNQLKALYPGKSNADIWKMVGVTPMIGQNDVRPEVFTQSDAQQLLSFAQQNNIGLLAMWSAARDKSCPDGGTQVAANCSGIQQQPFEFANIFKVFTR